VKFWYRRGAIAWLLWPASLVFGFVVGVRRILYRLRILPSRKPDIPVIIVGNITSGGSG
jgi:tetraacyldisaccharide 4'-kinase